MDNYDYTSNLLCCGLPIWFICGLIAGVIYRGKGRSELLGCIVGFLLGPIGILLALLSTTDKEAIEKKNKEIEEVKVQRGEMKKCPYCAEIVKPEAKVCRYCGRDLPS